MATRLTSSGPPLVGPYTFVVSPGERPALPVARTTGRTTFARWIFIAHVIALFGNGALQTLLGLGTLEQYRRYGVPMGLR